ncbi:MAG: phasin [Pseudorhodoplanes sp.]
MSDDVNQKLTEGWRKAFDAYGLSAVEMPAAFRKIAEKNLSACRENYHQVQAATERANMMLKQNYETANKGIAECHVKTIEAMHANVASTFDYYHSLLQAKTVAEVVEISSAHIRKQCETLAAQTKEFAALAQSVVTESSKSHKKSDR